MKHENPKHPPINKREIMENIYPLIENTLVRFDLIPVEISLEKEQHRWFLRIYIYSLTRAVTLDDCENVSRSLDTFLDELIPFKYYLEVSSPGTERKFKSDREYLIFNGKQVSVKLREPLEESADRFIKGKLVDFDVNKGVSIQVNDEIILINKENIVSTKLEDND